MLRDVTKQTWRKKQTQKEIFQVNTQDVVKKYAASLSIFVLAVGWVVSTGSDLAQIPPQVSPEGSPCTASYVQFLTVQPSNRIRVF